MTSVALANKDQIIARLSQGDRLIDIAKSYGLTTHAAISKYLASDPDYQAAREMSLEARMDERETQLEQAEDMMQVSKHRELLSHARWRAERECPKRWGKDQAAPGLIGPRIQIVIGEVSQSSQIIEHDDNDSHGTPDASD